MITESMKAKRREALAIVFVLAFCTLMFELMISRMSVFYLNYANAFLAIPLTLFGLAIGSLRVHLGKTPVEAISIGRNLVALTTFSILAYAVIFLIFSNFFPITHRNDPISSLMLGKTLAFIGVFLPPFFYVGKILTALYSTHREIIGKLYGRDLFGAALGGFATPILFHYLDLPYLIAICLMSMTVVTAISLGRTNWKLVSVFALLVLVCLPVLVNLESRYDMQQTVSESEETSVKEIAHRWNEFSRVSLLKIKNPGKPTRWKIVHDNAESNVPVIPYKPEQEVPRVQPEFKIASWLGRSEDRIMVMFAGCGRQMIYYDSIGAGQELLLGVEINPLVLKLATETEEMKRFRISEFLKKPNVQLHIAEGRRFLDNDSNTYDIIHVASQAATSKYKTGHSRKYLDTIQATEAYLDHLDNDGLLIFHCMPVYHKVESLKRIFQNRNLGKIDQHVIIAGKSPDNCGLLVFSKRPFTMKERIAFINNFREKRKIWYVPRYKKSKQEALHRVQTDEDPGLLLVTDDRPFFRPLDFDAFQLFPPKNNLRVISYYRSWVKIETMIGVCLLLVIILAGLYLFRAKMPPGSMMVYLLVTGFCYMLVEIAYISKLELFLESPLTSMALLLSVFLLTNGLGATLYNRFSHKLNMTIMPVFVAGIVLVSLQVIELLVINRLGWAMPLKVLITIIVVSPTGICLGFFYPFVVTWLTENNKPESVPITYGVSTLASVAGATYAMTMIINLGYSHIVYQAVVGYAALSCFVFIANRFSQQ